MKGSATGMERVGPFVYVRFHGAEGTYSGAYPEKRLERWADWLQQQRRAGITGLRVLQQRHRRPCAAGRDDAPPASEAASMTRENPKLLKAASRNRG